MTKEDAQEATMHAEFEVFGVKVLCSNSFGRVDKINNGISLLIDYNVNNKEDADKVETFYEQIEDHSSTEVGLLFVDRFWGDRMGIFTDKYGIRWILYGQDYTAIQQ